MEFSRSISSTEGPFYYLFDNSGSTRRSILALIQLIPKTNPVCAAVRFLPGLKDEWIPSYSGHMKNVIMKPTISNKSNKGRKRQTNKEAKSTVKTFEFLKKNKKNNNPDLPYCANNSSPSLEEEMDQKWNLFLFIRNACYIYMFKCWFHRMHEETKFPLCPTPLDLGCRLWRHGGGEGTRQSGGFKEKSCRLERGQESMQGRNEEHGRLKRAERTGKERGEGWGKEQRGLYEPETPSCGA